MLNQNNKVFFLTQKYIKQNFIINVQEEINLDHNHNKH